MRTDDTNATRRGSESNDLLGQASAARWYCLDRDGVAMLCKDEADARAQVIENDACWPGRAPHRAVLLGDVAAERERWRDELAFAEAALADIGDADREPGDDLAWCEKRAAEALPRVRAALGA